MTSYKKVKVKSKISVSLRQNISYKKVKVKIKMKLLSKFYAMSFLPPYEDGLFTNYKSKL